MCAPNAKLTDDEERAKDPRLAPRVLTALLVIRSSVLFAFILVPRRII